MLSRLVITFLPRSKLLLISWLQSPSTVILEPPKYKVAETNVTGKLVQMQALPPIDFKKLLRTLSLGCLVHKRGNVISISQYLSTLRVLYEIIYVKCPE